MSALEFGNLLTFYKILTYSTTVAFKFEFESSALEIQARQDRMIVWVGFRIGGCSILVSGTIHLSQIEASGQATNQQVPIHP